jgi:short-subunit dehydrogenase
MKRNDNFTVITGASRGLGKCLAKECARRGRNLILVALPKERIVQTANSLENMYGIKAVTYEVDLTQEEDLKVLTESVKANYKIDMLINNAGVGGTRQFDKATSNYINTIIQLNIRALVTLTHQLLPLLKAQKKAYVLNISSLAAFGPMPYKTIYPASKVFVSSFSRGLNAELKKSKVSVSVAYPGGMPTNQEIIERMSRHNKFIQSTFLSPEKTAKICLEQTFAGKTIIVPGTVNKFSRLLMKVIPENIRLNLFEKNLQKEMLDYAS